jgi:hypothetical protein
MGVLKEIFDLIKNGPDNEPSPEDKKRVAEVLDFVRASSPVGKKVIDDALKNGVVFDLEHDPASKTLGRFVPAFNRIYLDGNADNASLAAVAVHEGRHAVQKMGYCHEQTVKSSVTVCRAMEADAMAHECAAAYEMKSADPLVFETFKASRPNVAEAFEKEYGRSGDMFAAVGEAFRGWYDDASYVGRYDSKIMEFMGMAKTMGKAYKTVVSGSDVSALLDFDGKPYVPASFFGTERALTVSEKTAAEAEKIEKSHIRHLLKKPKTTSADDFYVRTASGEVKPPKALASFPVLQAARRGGR